MNNQTIQANTNTTVGALETLIAIALGALYFFVVTIHGGFFLKFNISKYSLPGFLMVYVGSLLLLAFWQKTYRKVIVQALMTFLLLLGFSFLLATHFFADTFDTSWDGQGYQSSGVINLARSWNPVYQNDLPFQPVDGDIFVKGYPKALWDIESSLYLTTGSLNASKVVNLYIAILALLSAYLLMRKLRIGLFISSALAVSVVLQAPFVMQALTFMADGYSYQLMLITLAGLCLFIIRPNIAVLGVTAMAIILLVSTKYSNIPIAIVASIALFFAVAFKGIKQQYSLSRVKMFAFGLTALVTLSVPYLTNQIHYGYMFYPTNLEAVNSTFHDDNTPKNLRESNNFMLLFYGIFGRAQTELMGKDHPLNVGALKIPFTFQDSELMNSAFVFNNRVGSMGPLFSGTVLISIVMLMFFFVASGENPKMRLIAMRILFAILVFTAIALVNPVPNLSRYNSQLVLIPFLVLISSFIWFQRSSLIKGLSVVLFFSIIGNTYLHVYSVALARTAETREIETQIGSLRDTPIEVEVKDFSSNLVRLEEHHISYQTVDQLPCSNAEVLARTSYTTKLCR